MVDERVKYGVEPASLSPLQVEDILTEAEGQQQQDEPLFLAVHTDPRTVYPDFLGFPLPLVSDRMKVLLEKYMPELKWKAAILTDFQQARQEVYWVLRPPMVDCLSAQTERYPNGTLKRLILRQGEIEPPVFRIEGLIEPHIYIHLAVAESLLRRSFTGIRVQRVEIEALRRMG
ncbi:hypothetical protein J2W97_004624 [Paenibacillus jamilae]|jgi:hypothetical protein|uniref:hypothetical protein n=1 Tax=Paenibacillus polymyxa TaxID=1406 RepID=UPI001580CC0C|nr:hypothetical protein [Paenibacillus polymyxa]MDP9678582.1 hypothetical protein [Paenibacillus jamilae]MBY0023080.1 hypothetical protein [Paenibacillus polymyxa]MBY0059688.1 hypothetical protein [Paenibacillus polymyxa]MBY0069230.1 hypothetical protein [Paenibacillus polymyxa]MBY0080334.1 hypothetical protein [Paenibacillus polymyxa]